MNRRYGSSAAAPRGASSCDYRVRPEHVCPMPDKPSPAAQIVYSFRYRDERTKK